MSEIIQVRTHHPKGDNTLLGVIRNYGTPERRPGLVEVAGRADFMKFYFPVGSLLRRDA